MTSYMYNPSQKVTEILSKFLEFDPAQLQLGIWSGDLSLTNVNLRQDAIYPLLNKAANKPHTDPSTKPPLHMKLVSGTVGHMRIIIPWKRLVWGQGDVKVEISDVSIVLAVQSREEVEAQRENSAPSKEEEEDKNQDSLKQAGVSKAYRDAKQRRLNEAERRHLQGMPMALYLNNLYRKNIIEKEAAKAEEAKEKEQKKTQSEAGRLDRWVKNATSDFFWRFYAGLQGAIKKVRIVVIQDGVEVGCIIQSIEVHAGLDGTKIAVNIEESSASEKTDEFAPAEMIRPPAEIIRPEIPEISVYESGYEDGEHVDKTISQKGMGIFVRKVVSMAKVPKTLQFSTSVSADDYILRPADLDLSFSFFYPFPPERRKKRSAENQSLGTSTTVASNDSTFASSKIRRGKRERVPPPQKRRNSLDNPRRERRRDLRRILSTESLSSDAPRRTASAMASARQLGDRTLPTAAVGQRMHRMHRRAQTDGATPMPQLSRFSSDNMGVGRFSSAKSIKSAVSMGTTGREVRSVLESPSVIAERPTQPVPKIECRLNFQDVSVVFSNRHYELLNYFVSNVRRIQNGRPNLAIRSVRERYTSAAAKRDILVDYTQPAPSPSPEKASSPVATPSSKLGSFLSLSQLRNLRSTNSKDNTNTEEVKLQINAAPTLSPRSVVVRQWWSYAMGAVSWAIRKKKHRRRNFVEMYVSFDWDRQKYKRQEYINLYIATKLDKSWQSDVWPFEEESREEKLLKIEDELPLEQILLYRSIARSIRVKGISKMPATILETYAADPVLKRGRLNIFRNTARVQTTARSRGNQTSGGSNLMALLQGKYKFTQSTRLRKNARKKMRGFGSSSDDTAERLSSGTPAHHQKTRTRFRQKSAGFEDISVGGNQSVSSDIRAGKFYSSGESRRDSRAGFRTINTKGRESVHPRQTVVGSVVGHGRDVDTRMRIAVSLHVKCIDLMVVEEDYIFDMPLHDLGKSRKSVGGIQLESGEFLDEEESSSDQLSDLSVLTDDQNFFEEGSIGTIAEEEEEDADEAKLSSTDFLQFGLPENVVLRLTVSSLGSSLHGISGAASQIGIYVGRFDIVDGEDGNIVCIGPTQFPTPVSEVSIGSKRTLGRRNREGLALDQSLLRSRGRDNDAPESALPRVKASEHAVSLILNREESLNSVECDVSKIVVNANLAPVERLLSFHSKSEVNHPSKLIPKSSRDVARELMVRKIAASSRFGAHISIAFRLHGFEINVPFNFDEVEASETSDRSSSSSSDCVSSRSQKPFQSLKSRAILSAGAIELYTGRVVEEMCAAEQEEQGIGSSSVASGFTSKITTLKSLKMIDVLELTSLHDSFDCSHWVANVSGVDCVLKAGTRSPYQLCRIPIDAEFLLTVNGIPLLETESPKHKVVVEISPVHLLFSDRRLALITAAQSTLGSSTLTSSTKMMKRSDPDPPRIEILSNRILHSLDLSCRQLQVDLVRDDKPPEKLSLKAKDLVMEESLSDFLSVVSCFDLDLPNEEALSSAMQVCIGRLVGLGLSDDEAWGCTNSARLNFLDDVALMRQAHNDALVHLSNSLRKESRSFDAMPEDGSLGSTGSDQERSCDEDKRSTISTDTTESDDDSADSAGIIDMTLTNAVEKTVAVFSPLLEEYQSNKDAMNSILSIELPLGLRLSLVKLFYDQHLTFLITSLVVANKAGIEILTLVPYSNDGAKSGDGNNEEPPGDSISFSRFDLDKSHGFGSGGLPMSVLGSDEGADADVFFRQRARFDDIDIGEIELVFSSAIFEEVIDEVSKFGQSKNSPRADSTDGIVSSVEGQSRPVVESSSVAVASCLSVLFANDSLVPFSRLTIEDVSFKNMKALEVLSVTPTPSWSLLSQSFVIQNLTPEGQFYPDVLAPLLKEDSEAVPFQLRYYASPDSWKFSSHLEIDFTGFRLYLLRNFIYELLHFFVYERYGLGRLKAKYSEYDFDYNGNSKPPLIYTVKVYDSSIICPRSSACSDMVSFELADGTVGVSYVPETFAMPTESAVFNANPQGKADISDASSNGFTDKAFRRESSASMAYFDCADESLGKNESVPISSFSKDVIRRLTINLDQVRAFTAIAESKTESDQIENPLFRFVHEVNGRAGHRIAVYKRRDSISEDMFKEVELSEQHWEEITTNPLDVEVLVDYAPHMRLLISNREGPSPFSLDARLSQLCLLLSVWDSNMQEMPAMFPFSASEVDAYARPPRIPDSFPAYGTEEFILYLEDMSSIRSEICCIFKKLSLRCSFDHPGRYPIDPYCFQYFKNPGCSEMQKQGLILSLEDAVVHVINDILNTKKIGIGSSFLELIDERLPTHFQTVLTTTPVANSIGDRSPPSWAEVCWGLRTDVHTLNSKLPVPVLFTIFMTPGWSLINFGAQDANGVMHDLSWLWIFLEYFKSYYTNIAFGNPAYQAQRWAHKMKNAVRKSSGKESVRFVEQIGRNIDVRLWLCRPILCLPSDYYDPHAPSLRLHSRTGLWYRYKSLQDFSSQEVATTDLNLFFVNEFQMPQSSRRSDVRGIMSAQPIIEGLSFGLRYDYNSACNHSDCSVLIPYEGDGIPSLALAGKELEVTPVILSPPTVCTPFKTAERSLGPRVCELTCIIEVIPITSATMMNFFTGPSKLNEDFAADEEDPGPGSFSVSASIGDLRVFAIDPVLGAQLPVAVLSVSSMSVTASKFAVETDPLVSNQIDRKESPPEDLHVVADCNLWADYFKLGLTRSWEPLLEPFQFLLLYERSQERGQGVSIDADSPFHLNLTGAVLQVLGETVDSFSTLIRETFASKTNQSRVSRRLSMSMAPPTKTNVGAMAHDEIKMINGNGLSVLHETPKPLKQDDRVAFSLRNMTGQKVRLHQQADVSTASGIDTPAMVTYLNQAESVGLTFAATISVIKNLCIEEIPFPGFQNSRSNNRNQGSLNQTVDLQVPGFRWMQGVKVDTFGRKFQALSPRSDSVISKISRDWRLRNALMLLTEVGFDNGGRLVTVRSLFEIRNDTSHPIKLVFHPDPRYRPLERTSEKMGFLQKSDTPGRSSITTEDFVNHEEIEVIHPGEVFPIPTLLLERALQLTGSHLGCFWLCPDTRDKSISYLEFARTNESSEKSKEFNSAFCSRPVQLAKIVHESSQVFKIGSGQDIAGDDAKTGIQVSCSTRSSSGEVWAPFCYAVEVGRSPLVKFTKDKSTSNSNDLFQMETDAAKKLKRKELIHAPVAYTLSIHAPIVVVNLLPEGGRFELMHAVRKTVLWYADLQPGQQVPVHSVGLDAPLLLLVNLGFCRTPVGEGALVHHGVDSPIGGGGGKEQGVRFKDIGKAAMKGTKQIGKTLTAMSDSPDKRGRGKLAEVNAAQFHQREKRKRKAKGKQAVTVTDESLGLDTSLGGMDSADHGKVHAVESAVYSSSDVATSTTVVDSVGQRLTLKIENVRGGGGQRRISLFCPFWIVNNTQHSLRYKQDKAKSFVSGTVISPDRDGSMPVDGSNRNYRNLHKLQSARRNMSKGTPELDNIPMNTKTIFSGTPGSLATSPGRCNLQPAELAELIEKDVPLHKLADLAFMFNFHEGLSIGNQMLSVQLYDGSNQSHYRSDWSRGVSLDSVGYFQIVGMHCKEGRALELSVEVNVAPGFLSAYTKIVRFLPRYVVFNRLERPIRLWQDSSVFRAVNEDRAAAATETLQSSKLSRKWRYDFEETHHHEKINQYESLFGRPVILDDRKGNMTAAMLGTDTISEGTTAHKSAQYIASVGPSELAPFLLPDTRAERQFRIDLGGMWNVTSSFASELPGEHNLKITRATDLSLLKHVSTRAPKYKIVLPPPDDASIGEWDAELGVFFETDWGGERTIIVKGTKRGKYAYNHTDIHVGDELLRVDGVSVLRMSFAETMKLMKERLAFVASARRQLKNAAKQPKRGLRRLSLSGQSRRFSSSFRKQSSYEEGSSAKPAYLTLTFRTFEERLRKLRLKAGTREGNLNLNLNLAQRRVSGLIPHAKIDGISVEMKSWHNTMFVVIREQDQENPLFRIQNRSINHIVFYRQRGCDGHPWNHLMPGESKPYSWEEPMKSKKLSVRVAAKSQDIFKLDEMAGSQDAFSEEGSDVERDGDAAAGDPDKHAGRGARLRQAFAQQFVDTEERGGYGPSISVRLEEIGYSSLLPVQAKEAGRSRKFLNCEVDTDGGTRLLVVSDDSSSVDERLMLKRHLDTLKKQITYEQDRIAELNSHKLWLSQTSSDFVADGSTNDMNGRVAAVESDASRLVDDFPEESTINGRHQVIVEVVEAIGLNVSDFVGSCNPYCEVFLKGRSKSRKYFFQKRKNKRKTYFIQKSLNPRWTDQVFVYDVPQEAVSVTRGFTLQVKVRNFRMVGQHSILGQAAVHFGSLRNQQELVGWYPLSGRSGQRDGDTLQVSDSSRGSIKLRVQWIYTVPALIDYFLLISQRRLGQLMKSREGMTDQLAHAIEAEKDRREAIDQLGSGRIQNLVKLQRKKTPRRKMISRNEAEREKMVGKINHGLNSGLSQLKDSLKTSRDRYLYALYFQTVESRRNRLEKKEAARLGNDKSSRSLDADTKSPSTLKNSKKSLESFFSEHSISASATSEQSRYSPEKFQNNRRALNDFFSLQTRRSLRRLSLGVDEPVADEESMSHEQIDQWSTSMKQGQAIYDGLYGQERGISEIMSVGTSSEDQPQQKRMIHQLLLQGFLFHECGDFFHQDHLPHNFGKSLSASAMDGTKIGRPFRPKSAVGTATTIRHFRSWQSAYAIYWDSECGIYRTDDTLELQVKEKAKKPPKPTPAVSQTRLVILDKLAVPDDSPLSTVERAQGRADTMYMSRLKFERACKRILGSVLNPGGWLTIRPITVLNLPDTYTGMFVKLRYGSEVLVSETVDAKVTPRWSATDFSETTQDSSGKFKFNNNDLHVRVEPQQTSGSIKISVVAERLNSKSELGVLQLPLGAAIAACIDSAEELLESTIDGEAAGQPMYVRWFPLMEPRMAEPVEGDMGLSSRPKESEKIRDNMFEQYFTPCMQLALIWWPDKNDSSNDGSGSKMSGNFSNSMSSHRSAPILKHTTTTPVIQNYFNADISRISAALIDSQRAVELLSFAATDIDVRYSVSKTKTRVGLVVGWVQLDHQDSRAREPVVLAPTPMEDLQPTLQFLALRDNVKTKSNIVSYEYIGVYLQEMDLTVEEFWIFELWDFFMGVIRRSRVKRNTYEGRKAAADALSQVENCFINDEDEDVFGPSLLSILQGPGSGASGSKKKFYIEQLILGLVKINLSYIKGKKQSWEMADQGALSIKNLEVTALPNLAAATSRNKANSNVKPDQSDAFQRWSQHTYDEDLFAENGVDPTNHLPGIIAAVFPSVSDASIRLQGKVIEHVFESPGEIFSSIKNFYVNETLKQVYKIIGSIDFVGNPTTIISSFMSGVRDLVVAPATAIMKSPTDVNQVGIEVAKGTISFFSHSTSGIFGFLAKMSASAGQTVAILSLDSEYRQWHRDTVVSEATDLNRVWKRRGMQKASHIVFRPVGDILLGVAMGASGLIISPYKGFKKGGTLGLMRGVATGTAGVVAKPLVGVLDAFTHFSATVHDVARSANVLERRYQPALKLRLQYSFGPMKVLSPFDAVTARAMDLLKAFPPKAKRSKSQGGRSAEFQIHSEVLHMEHGVETYAIVSTIRVVLIKLKRDNNGLSPSFGWEVSLAGDALVKSLLTDHGHNGVALTIKKRAEAKDSPMQEKSRQGQRGSRQGPIRNMISSSAISVDSAFTITDSEPPQMSQEASSDTGDSPQQEDSTYRYGSTRKGGEILEWFTVLAEFQHRVQLTKLHNAICCVVEDFDAVVVDHAGDSDPPYKGATTFGLYTFGASSQDSNTSPSSNVDLIAALEHLPWMHDATFNMIRNLPEKNQVAEVSRLRQGWMFSNELEASRQLGGPKWLVEARARAMFVPSEPPVTPEYLDPYDPVVEKVYIELEQGNISSAQASRLFESHSGAVFSQSDYDDLGGDGGEVFSGEGDSGEGDGVSGTPRIVEFGSTGNNLQSQQMGSDEVAERRNSDESFYSAQVDNPLLPVEVEAVGESGKTVKSAVSFESDNLLATSPVDRGESIEPSGVPAASRSGKGYYDSTTFSKMSKIDRMESLMEQLIQLNAHQATRQAIPSEMFSETHSSNHESRIADSVIHELSELRSQVQVRANEDEELRKEIALLRQQLAEKNQKKDSNKKSKKMPDILGFGKSRKDQGSELDRNVESDSKLSAGEVNVRGTEPTFTEGRIVRLPSPSKNHVKNFSGPVARRRRSNSNDGSVDSALLTAEEHAISRRSSRDSTPDGVRIEGYAARGRSLSRAGSGSFDSSVDRSVNNVTQQVRNRRPSGLSAERSLDSMAGEGLNNEFTTPGEDIVGEKQSEKQSKKKGKTFSKMFRFGKKNRASDPAITDQDKS